MIFAYVLQGHNTRNSYNQNLQTQIYHVIVDALNRFTYNKYEKQDKLYDAAESILRGFVSTKDNTDAVKSGLKMLVSDVNNDTSQDFFEILYSEICKDDNNGLFKEIDMLRKRWESEYIHKEFEKSIQNDIEVLGRLNDLKEDLDYIKENVSTQERYKVDYYEIPIENRAKEYASKWDKNVFLNDFNERDENAGVNIKLKDIYLEEHLPHYIWKENHERLYDLKDLLSEYIVNSNDKKMLLILGKQGIGKSTLITWVLSNLIEKKEEILVYQFASDLKNVKWKNNNILGDIFKIINLKNNELENKVLILDGFDEIFVSDKEEILNQIYHELKNMNYIKGFSLIITCRENYVFNMNILQCDYIMLQVWDEKQIKSFCKIYEEKNNSKNSEITISELMRNTNVFGIPLILYMILALNVTIEEYGSIVDVYDRIFSLDGDGIYDRCIRNSCYAPPHRISKVKRQIHQVSQRIAFWMFENESTEVFINKLQYERICKDVANEMVEKSEDLQSDVLIGSYFERIRHCEETETDKLQFVHRSIYEYFVAIYFFESICEMKSKKKIAGKLGELLKDGRLTVQILEFIKYKFESTKGSNIPDIAYEIFEMMLQNGMTYYIETKYTNIIEREMNIFANMLAVVHLWKHSLGEIHERIITYLQYNKHEVLNLDGIRLNGKMHPIILSGIYLEGASLEKACLEGVSLIGADLLLTNLKGANLAGACLKGACLQAADLEGADLKKVDLSEADLEGAYLVGADITGADFKNANFNVTVLDEQQILLLQEKYNLDDSKVYVPETNEIITYEEYCKVHRK